MKSSILIIDDEVKLSELMGRILMLEGYNVLQACNAKNGMRLIEREDIRVVLSDVKLPDANGLDLVERIKKIKPYIEVINLTAFGSISDGVLAIKNGAFDYLTKGDDNDKIIPLVSKAIAKANLQFQISEIQKQTEVQHGFPIVLGQSPAILEAVDLAKKVAKTDATVLLLGETGTGKEVFAEAIHVESMRNDKPFVAVNCSAFSKELLESELFGYKAGAFTGAIKDKKGLFEEASGGTIFLDELGEMGHDLQAKLLRVLENGTFIKIGETKTTKVNVRLIAATNRDLQKESEEGHFRLDLFYRLSGFSIVLPPLRERVGDIEVLARHFIRVYAAKVKKKAPEVDERFFKLLNQHKWNGNIRELKNVIERVIILMDEPLLTPKLLPNEFHNGGYYDLVALDLNSVEKHHIRRILKYVKGNKTEAARVLGIGLATLYRKIEEYHILPN
ncbi:DNA-binding transcriptional response regulator, NtrC family, contains REC, AAA-type ATPase, and a Fis-type DNA-binding domains [Mucilaginibacter pineti]|uniref:DNA-binding transcriptional response regulator, NtrC family, contains REC, AAA-type ATPase, and a Fis-type DNA-binding domains n=1 Tax=Mucilaginibacter pineti TaxID=1391627 RepID=A0A1G6X3G2_9SPHI|nr:sigma-54 dependent transcriptional regulator [Mucilaginibacter pineti]SDD71806.1 DNA-binding transcriptional response regulator, NtrC family, contains REC, AAA-type ATPase, and a Fis-type DNA-binding domains [Mucilaginibacter pineti]